MVLKASSISSAGEKRSMDKQTRTRWRTLIVFVFFVELICVAALSHSTYAFNTSSSDSTSFLNPKKEEERRASTPAVVEGKKRALLIGISQYARKGGKDKDGIHDLDWWDLHTEYDIELLEKTLTESKFGFKPENIRILKTPGETTRAAILQALNNLIGETKPGDIVYIHYSGHGQPAPDRTRPDGMVKTLVPSDYVSQLNTSKNIRGDEIGKLLDQLKGKNPANITVTFDSCFSYSAVRGDELTSRGADPLNLIGNAGTERGNNENANNFLNKLTLPEGYVFLSAASQVQTAKEYYIDGDRSKPVGLFTLALTKAMEKSGPNTTYRDVLEMVNDFVQTIRRDQSPQIEGRTEQKLFDGEVAPSDRYVGVTTRTVRTSSGSEKRIILQAGMLQGMTKGSKFEIYPAGTKKRYDKGSQDLQPLATAVIETTDPITSELRLSPDTSLAGLDEGQFRSARAFETEHNYTSVLKVAIDDALRSKDRGNRQLKNLSLDKLRLEDLAATVDPDGTQWNVKIRPPLNCQGTSDTRNDPNCQAENNFQGVVLQRPDGSVIARFHDDDALTKNIRDTLERESRIFVVRTLGDGVLATNSADTSLQVKLRMIPVDVEFAEDGKVVKKVIGDRTDEAGKTFSSSSPTLYGDDYVMLELVNTGTVDAYVTVIDLQPDGKIKPAFPYPGIPHDNLVKHGTTYRVPYPYVFHLTEPYGQESFRLIATREAADFSPLLDPETLDKVVRGEGDERGESALKSPLGKILLNAQKGKRGDLSGIPAEWTTSSVSFIVLPPR
jgi:hypothetical protein